MDVGDPAILLIDGQQHIVFLNRFPVCFLGDRIDRDLRQVMRRDQIVERLRSFLLVECIVPDGIA